MPGKPGEWIRSHVERITHRAQNARRDSGVQPRHEITPLNSTQGEIKNSFIAQKVSEVSSSFHQFKTVLTDKGVDQDPAVIGLLEQFSSVYQVLFDNPDANYHDFNYQTSSKLSQALGETLEKLEGEGQEKQAKAVVEALFTPYDTGRREKDSYKIPLMHYMFVRDQESLAEHSKAFAAKQPQVYPPQPTVTYPEMPAQSPAHTHTQENQLIQQVAEEREKRAEEIGKFYRNELTPEQQAQVVKDMRENRVVRLAYIFDHDNNGANYPQMPEEPLDRLGKAQRKFFDWAAICPGSSYIAGIETRPDIPPQRESAYRSLERALAEIEGVHPLEAFVLENEYLMRQNKQKVPHLTNRYDEWEGVAGAMMSVFRPQFIPSYMTEFQMPKTPQEEQQ